VLEARAVPAPLELAPAAHPWISDVGRVFRPGSGFVRPRYQRAPSLVIASPSSRVYLTVTPRA
jgi:hypothetical protein